MKNLFQETKRGEELISELHSCSKLWENRILPEFCNPVEQKKKNLANKVLPEFVILWKVEIFAYKNIRIHMLTYRVEISMH